MKPRVLLIEDNAWLAERCLRELDKAKLTTSHATTAAQAIDIIDKDTPSVIIADILLPASNSFSLFHELRSHSDLASIPIIVLSTIADQLTLTELTPYGVVELLDKATLQIGDIASAVQRHL